MKTTDQIQSEIQKLRDIRPRVRKTTAFGHDNHAAIDVQIEALTAVSCIVNLDELTSLPEADQFLRGEFDDMPWNVKEAAQEAIDWASDYNDTVSLVDGDGWESIAK
jgi:hypothetical protein